MKKQINVKKIAVIAGTLVLSAGAVWLGLYKHCNCAIRRMNLKTIRDSAESRSKKLKQGESKLVTDTVYFGGTENEESYTGMVKSGAPEGYGVLVYNQGRSTYTGQFLHGKVDGPGMIRTNTGYTYEGAFKNGKKEGQGKESFSDGSNYEGEFKNSLREGNGRFQWFDGSVYMGGFVADKVSGRGTLVYSNGAVYTGEFVNGEKEGLGTQTYPDGTKYVGYFKKSMKSGEGTVYHADGSIDYQGEFENGSLISKTGVNQQASLETSVASKLNALQRGAGKLIKLYNQHLK